MDRFRDSVVAEPQNCWGLTDVFRCRYGYKLMLDQLNSRLDTALRPNGAPETLG